MEDDVIFYRRNLPHIHPKDGAFWHHESYDHYVRDEELNRIIQYIVNNPVKAGMVEDWRDWKFTYLA